jgi:hypothetical protein
MSFSEIGGIVCTDDEKERKIISMAIEMLAAAIDLEKRGGDEWSDDCSEDDFALVMWPDEHCQQGLSREAYRDAVTRAYRMYSSRDWE